MEISKETIITLKLPINEARVLRKAVAIMLGDIIGEDAELSGLEAEELTDLYDTWK